MTTSTRGTTEPKLGLIGRDLAVMQILSRGLRFAALGGLATGPQGGGKRVPHETTDLQSTHRGFAFDVRVFDEHGEPTGHIAHVAVTLAGVEQRADYERDLAIRNAR